MDLIEQYGELAFSLDFYLQVGRRRGQGQAGEEVTAAAAGTGVPVLP